MTYTMVAPVMWPVSLMRERFISWQLIRRRERSLPSLDGTVQSRSMLGGGFWMSTFSQVQLNRLEYVLSWQALDIQLEGGGVPVLVSSGLCRNAPWPVVDGVKLLPSLVPFSPTTPFSDASLFESGVINAETVGSRDARDTNIRVEMNVGSDPQAGQDFSILHPTYGWRMYRIHSVEGAIAGRFDLEIRPTLREAVEGAVLLNFDNPCCVMTVAEDQTMLLDLQGRRRAEPSVVFVEAGI